MYEDVTVEAIKTRILDRLTTGLQTREGSFVNDVISAAAAEICECYHSIDAMLPAFYVDESSGEYIDRQAEIVGIIRKPGTMASCEISFTGIDGAFVPAGMPFYTAAGLTFLLRDSVTIADGTAAGILDAREPGTAGNIGAGEIVQTLRNCTGITGYTNSAAEGGTDTETDESLLTRYLDRMRASPTSGNPYHYQMWAKEVPGVGAARVIAKWNGPGTVKVVIADSEMSPPAASIVTACADHISEQRPVGAAVTVAAAQGTGIAIAAAVTIDTTTTKQAVQAALSTAAVDYFASLVRTAFADNIDLDFETMADKRYYVLYNRVAYLLLSIPGVLDYTSLTLNGETGNIQIPADGVPVLAGVVVT